MKVSSAKKGPRFGRSTLDAKSFKRDSNEINLNARRCLLVQRMPENAKSYFLAD